MRVRSYAHRVSRAGRTDGGAPRARRRFRPRLGRPTALRVAPVVVIAVALAVVSAIVIPRLHADGDVDQVSYDFVSGSALPGLTTNGPVQREPYGFLVPSSATA